MAAYDYETHECGSSLYDYPDFVHTDSMSEMEENDESFPPLQSNDVESHDDEMLYNDYDEDSFFDDDLFGENCLEWQSSELPGGEDKYGTFHFCDSS